MRGSAPWPLVCPLAAHALRRICGAWSQGDPSLPLRDVTPGSIPDAPHEPTAPACPLPLLAYTKPLSCVAQTTLTQGGVDLTVGSLSRTTLSDRSFGSLLWIAHSDILFGSLSRIAQSQLSRIAHNIRTAHSDRSFGSLRRIAHFTFRSLITLLYKKFDPPVRI